MAGEMTAVNVSEAEAAVMATPVATRKASTSAAAGGGRMTSAKPSGGTSEPLRTGDLVYFCGLHPHFGLLQAEGFCTARVGLQPLPRYPSEWAQHSQLPPNIDECVFRLCPPLEYDMIEIAQSSGLKTQSSMSGEELELARHRARTQGRKNEAALARLDEKDSTALLFGQRVQLQQVSSGRFLSGEKRMAEVERKNMLLTVAEGSKYAIFKVQPKYKFRKEGDVVYDTDEIMLESVEIPKHTIGGSDALFDARAADPESAVREANLSEEESGWSIHKCANTTTPARASTTTTRKRLLRLLLDDLRLLLILSHPNLPSLLAGTRARARATASSCAPAARRASSSGTHRRRRS